MTRPSTPRKKKKNTSPALPYYPFLSVREMITFWRRSRLLTPACSLLLKWLRSGKPTRNWHPSTDTQVCTNGSKITRRRETTTNPKKKKINHYQPHRPTNTNMKQFRAAYRNQEGSSGGSAGPQKSKFGEQRIPQELIYREPVRVKMRGGWGGSTTQTAAS